MSALRLFERNVLMEHDSDAREGRPRLRRRVDTRKDASFLRRVIRREVNDVQIALDLRARSSARTT